MLCIGYGFLGFMFDGDQVVLEAYEQMGETAEALDNEEMKSLPQSIFTAASLLIEWVQGQIRASEIDEVKCQERIDHDRVQNEE